MALAPQLLLVFDYGDLEEFQQYFSLLDVDNSGDLSGKEIKVLLRAMDIQVSAFEHPDKKFFVEFFFFIFNLIARAN